MCTLYSFAFLLRWNNRQEDLEEGLTQALPEPAPMASPEPLEPALETFAKRTGVLSTTAAQFPAFPQPTKREGCPEPKSCASSCGSSPTGTCTFVQQPHSYTRATDHIVPPPGKSAWKSTTKSKRKKKISTNDYP